MPAKNILLSVQEKMFDEMVHVAHDLTQLGYNLYATESTHEYLQDKGVSSTLVKFPGEGVSSCLPPLPTAALTALHVCVLYFHI